LINKKSEVGGNYKNSIIRIFVFLTMLDGREFYTRMGTILSIIRGKNNISLESNQKCAKGLLSNNLYYVISGQP